MRTRSSLDPNFVTWYDSFCLSPSSLWFFLVIASQVSEIKVAKIALSKIAHNAMNSRSLEINFFFYFEKLQYWL